MAVVKEITDQIASDLIAGLELFAFEVENDRYLVIHYNAESKIVEFEDKNEFATYLITLIENEIKNDEPRQAPEFKRDDMLALVNLSKLLQ